jgi:hypothetical protein
VKKKTSKKQKPGLLYFCHIVNFKQYKDKVIVDKSRFKKGFAIVSFNCNTSYSDSSFICEDNDCYECGCYRGNHLTKHIVVMRMKTPLKDMIQAVKNGVLEHYN